MAGLRTGQLASNSASVASRRFTFARAWANLGVASLLTGDRARAMACLERLRPLDRVRAAKLAAELDAAP